MQSQILETLLQTDINRKQTNMPLIFESECVYSKSKNSQLANQRFKNASIKKYTKPLLNFDHMTIRVIKPL